MPLKRRGSYDETKVPTGTTSSHTARYQQAQRQVHWATRVGQKRSWR